MEYNITYRKKDKGWQYIISVKENKGWKYAGSKQGFPTKALAKIAADEHVEKMKNECKELKPLPEHKGLTFQQLATAYKEHRLIHNSFNTITHLEAAINYFTGLNDKQVKNITTLDIQLGVNTMVKAGLATSTISLYVHNIKMMFKYAIKPYNVIKENPVRDIDFPKKKGKREKIRALTKSELETLLSKIKYPKYYIASLLLSKCGLRIGELLGLTWDCIDFENKIITVDKQWKQLQEGVWGFGDLKSDNSYRDIPAPAVVISELIKFRQYYPVHISGRILPYVHTSGFGTTLMNLYRKLGFNISAHDLRHTYATTLLSNGLDFETVARLMGHDVKETIETYSHVTSDMMKNAREIINSVF